MNCRLPSHPGGPLIFSKAGGDNTALFDAYHPLYVHKMLRRFLIGSVREGEQDPAYPTYADDTTKGEFYHTVRSRVEALMKKKGVDPRVSLAMYIKSIIILFGLVCSYYGMFYFDFAKLTDTLNNMMTSSSNTHGIIEAFPNSITFVLISALRICATAGPVLCAILFGFFQGEIGVSIQHDANHGCYSKSPILSMVAGWTLDLAGASSFMWKQQHVVGHHAYTNVVDVGTYNRLAD